MKGLMIGFGVFVILGIFIAIWAVGVSNRERELFIKGKAAQQNSQVIFDNAWKIIAQQAEVVGKYKDDFKEVYVELMDARYKNDAGAGQQTMMKWITENHIPLDAGLYTKLMNSIVGSRDNFTVAQQQLIDVDREHKTLKATFPNSLIIGSRPNLDIKLVTSAKTAESFDSGMDNDIKLYPNKDEEKK